MSKSIWVIVVFGVIALGLMLVLMMYGLDSLTTGPAGNRVRLAGKLLEKFRMKSVGVYVVEEGGKPLMRISYRTEQETDYSAIRQLAEIREVAAFAAEKYEGGDLRKIEKIQVIRTELVHRGCWTGTDSREATLPNPAYRSPQDELELRFKRTSPR